MLKLQEKFKLIKLNNTLLYTSINNQGQKIVTALSLNSNLLGINKATFIIAANIQIYHYQPGDYEKTEFFHTNEHTHEQMNNSAHHNLKRGSQIMVTQSDQSIYDNNDVIISTPKSETSVRNLSASVINLSASVKNLSAHAKTLMNLRDVLTSFSQIVKLLKELDELFAIDFNKTGTETNQAWVYKERLKYWGTSLKIESLNINAISSELAKLRSAAIKGQSQRLVWQRLAKDEISSLRDWLNFSKINQDYNSINNQANDSEINNGQLINWENHELNQVLLKDKVHHKKLNRKGKLSSFELYKQNHESDNMTKILDDSQLYTFKSGMNQIAVIVLSKQLDVKVKGSVQEIKSFDFFPANSQGNVTNGKLLLSKTVKDLIHLKPREPYQGKGIGRINSLFKIKPRRKK